MQEIIGRTTEIAELKNICNSKRPEFVIIYGRRRVGKTFLIRNLFESKFAFSHTGLSQQEMDTTGQKESQLQNFASSLRRYGKNNQTTPQNWLSAFDCLQELLEEKFAVQPQMPQIVFIDELPWLDTPRSGFLTALEHFWNGWGATQEQLKLIVCGSATSWIADNLIHNKGGLYGRKTQEIKLHPFTLREAEQYYISQGINLDRYAQLQLYMMLGGIPYYMSFVKKGKSIEQIVKELFADQNAKFKNEFEQLFVSLFTNHQDCIKIIQTLATKKDGYTRKQISDNTKIPYGGGLTKTLKALKESDFIQKYTYYGQPAKEERYRLIDPFVLFAIKVLNKQNTPDSKIWKGIFNKKSIEIWQGFTFESLCRYHISQIKQALGISSVETAEFSWRSEKTDEHPGAQIDMVIRRADRIINLCEMKFYISDYVIDKDEEAKIRNRIATFQRVTKCKETIHPILITTFGLIENKYSNLIQNVITLDDLFKPNRS
ncbi:MAG: ATP-binding protein [Bacteroidaceae bacterium]